MLGLAGLSGKEANNRGTAEMGQKIGRWTDHNESLAKERIVFLDPLSVDPKANEISPPLQTAPELHSQSLRVL